MCTGLFWILACVYAGKMPQRSTRARGQGWKWQSISCSGCLLLGCGPWLKNWLLTRVKGISPTSLGLLPWFYPSYNSNRAPTLGTAVLSYLGRGSVRRCYEQRASQRRHRKRGVADRGCRGHAVIDDFLLWFLPLSVSFCHKIETDKTTISCSCIWAGTSLCVI